MVQFVEKNFYKLDVTFLQTGSYKLLSYKLVPYRMFPRAVLKATTIFSIGKTLEKALDFYTIMILLMATDNQHGV